MKKDKKDKFMITDKFNELREGFAPMPDRDHVALQRLDAYQVKSVFRDETNDAKTVIEFEEVCKMLEVDTFWSDQCGITPGGWVVSDGRHTHYHTEEAFKAKSAAQPMPATFKAIAKHNKKDWWFDVLNITPSTLNGREKRLELNNGRLTDWKDAEEVRLFMEVGGCRIEITI
jgi:hypothetical protein